MCFVFMSVYKFALDVVYLSVKIGKTKDGKMCFVHKDKKFIISIYSCRNNTKWNECVKFVLLRSCLHFYVSINGLKMG